MRRFFLGEQSRFVESTLGRIALIILFTAVMGVVLSLLFLTNTFFAPVILKYAIVASLGLAASLMSRRLLAGRNRVLRFFSALFAAVVTLGILNFLTRGYVGLQFVNNPGAQDPLDAGLQIFLSLAAVLAVQIAWRGARREVMVEPRYEPEPEPIPVRRPAPQPRRASISRTPSSELIASLNSKVRSVLAWLNPPAGKVRTRRKVSKPAKRVLRRRVRDEISLSADEEHLCPYCLEPVVKGDPRGVKICKVCKTWHHADCWAITGVCQVPHQYVS